MIATVKILNALESITGKRAKLSCKSQDGRIAPLLTAVSVCYDTNLNYIDCPQSARACLDKIYIVNAPAAYTGFVTSRETLPVQSPHTSPRGIDIPKRPTARPMSEQQLNMKRYLPDGGVVRGAWASGSPARPAKNDKSDKTVLDDTSFPSLSGAPAPKTPSWGPRRSVASLFS